MGAGEWDPRQYERFATERRQPFLEVLRLLRPVPGGRIADLGCGNGTLTTEMKGALLAAEALGIDTSPAMLAEARPAPGVAFEQADLATWAGDGRRWDVITAHASLQWVPDHAAVLRRWTSALPPGGQLAVQVPANRDHPSHLVLEEVAHDLGIDLPPDHLAAVLAPEQYAELLDELGFEHQTVRLQVFGHRLASTSEVIEWTKGTAQVRVREATDAGTYERFAAHYRQRLLARLGDRTPYFYAFKRILFVARLAR